MYRFRCYDNSAERELSASALYTLYAWFLNYSVENGLGETNFKMTTAKRQTQAVNIRHCTLSQHQRSRVGQTNIKIMTDSRWVVITNGT